jgi:hypothetical protein
MSRTLAAPAFRFVFSSAALSQACLQESDESVVDRLLENPYWQYFCGFEYFQHELSLDPTSLVKWRKRIGPKGMEKLLAVTIETAKSEHRMDRNYLKGEEGDKIKAILAGCGFNIRKLLRAIHLWLIKERFRGIAVNGIDLTRILRHQLQPV